MIRILHVVTIMNRGGLETFIMNVYRSIDRQKVQFDFLVHRDEVGDYDEEIRNLGGRIFKVKKFNPISISYYKDLYSKIKQNKSAAAIHVHMDCTSGVVLLVAKLVGIKVRIAHAHTASLDRNWKRIVKILLKPLIKYFATNLFACGAAAGDFVFGKRIKFEILNNGIDVDKFRFDGEMRAVVRRELGISNERVILHVGRFDEVKNQIYIVKNLCCYEKNNKNYCFLFVGDGVLKKQIEEFCVKEKCKNVKFLGKRNDVNRLLQAADLFVFPSLYEGVSLAIIEAQASGLFCLINDQIPHECKVTERVLFESLKNPSKWVYWIENNHSELREIYADKVRMKGFDIYFTAKKLQKFYLDPCNKIKYLS